MPKTKINADLQLQCRAHAYRHMHLTTLVQQTFRKTITLRIELDCQLVIEGVLFHTLVTPRSSAAEYHQPVLLPLLLVCTRPYMNGVAFG